MSIKDIGRDVEASKYKGISLDEIDLNLNVVENYSQDC